MRATHRHHPARTTDRLADLLRATDPEPTAEQVRRLDDASA
ncbi:hypothetical protein OU415_35625 [Saccharopolyspora sp. WRP15-2]|uniref:Uncharacterized protein n=1 Tax=Saccharopolyspora oryzae TaxID=2997343 RepID=A0ABT4VA35_9PSEU|nr:hypothetical protein [Saccharopolyspora oryzae]MDA3630803.1 hypothetical protein [Saccharopolyspora oryzae]